MASALAVPPLPHAGDRERLLVALAVAGFLATLTTLLGVTRALTWAVLAFGAEHTVSFLGRATVGADAALVGAGLVVLAELSHWSLARRSPAWQGWMDRRLLADLTFVGLGSAAVASLVLVAATPGVSAGPWLTALGAGAACATLGLVLVLARRASRGRRPPGNAPGGVQSTVTDPEREARG